ncbi:DNA adenine methylase [Leptospira meyeri]|uniref:DNA adenine methylase n=1 Tax=Leptospira meyeri TaxID=29508 RepID=UPI0002C03D8A|nr:DNA adenine methylase [Leptospira meyeri]EMJ87269.1 hypothetical protein LEP1GSC196_2960 [Leptospira meyeri serovar Semaranga str. Veldrot Semarang 173]
MHEISSPLRYPGGKAVLTQYLAELIKTNKLHDSTYIEPYAGGAGAALNLLYKEYVPRIVINDADPMIYAFWHSVLNETEDICKKIMNVKLSMNAWDKKQKIIRDIKNHSQLELGFAAFYLNRTNRSGIISGGPIGGRLQKGKWKLDARFNRKALIDRIQKIAYYKDRIEISNLDAIKLMSKRKKEKKNKLFFFLDPPYYNKGSDLYMNYYKPNDHQKLSEHLSNQSNEDWVLTYDNVEEISKLYKQRRSMYYDINYSAGNVRKGDEIIIFSDSITIPKSKILLSK